MQKALNTGIPANNKGSAAMADPFCCGKQKCRPGTAAASSEAEQAPQRLYTFLDAFLHGISRRLSAAL
jgi:hypothetical protein